MCHLGELINQDNNEINSRDSPRQSYDKIHGDVLPGPIRDRKSGVQSSILSLTLKTVALLIMTHKSHHVPIQSSLKVTLLLPCNQWKNVSQRTIRDIIMSLIIMHIAYETISQRTLRNAKLGPLEKKSFLII